MSNTVTLAKNSVALFFRMALRLVISLYATRVILEVLGEDSYGIYVLVAGFTVMFAFVNASMSTAVSRFISYSLGNGDTQMHLTKIFQTAIYIQTIVALLVVVIGGIVGYYFISTVLDIPPILLSSAKFLFFCTLAGLVFNIYQVPYNAVIISYEKMSAYAYIEVVNSVLLLGIALLLKLNFEEPLKIYGILLLVTYSIIFLSYKIYCKRFSICKFGFCSERTILKPFLSFSGSDLFSNSTMSIQTQGQNVIFNRFFSLTSNAAIGISNQVYGALLMFSNSITTAIRPQIIKSYANGDKVKSMHLTLVGSKLLSMALIVISVPIILRIDYILTLWLHTYPTQAPVFVAIILIMNASYAYKAILVILLQATGKIERYSMINGIFYLLAIPFQYLLANTGLGDVTCYSIIFLLAFFNVIINIVFISIYLEEKMLPLLVRYIFPPMFGLGLCIGISYWLNELFDQTFIQSVLFGILSVAVNIVICWFVVLNKESRMHVSSLLSQAYSKLMKK